MDNIFYFQANIILVGIIYIIMWVITGFSVYDDPVTVGIGLGLFVIGAPVYYCFLTLSKTQSMSRIMGTKCFSFPNFIHRLQSPANIFVEASKLYYQHVHGSLDAPKQDLVLP